MVYCNFIKAINDKAIYSIGGTIKDITGELTIDLSNDFSFEVTKQPENSEVCPTHIEFMIGHHLQEFRKRLYPSKMAYQI